MRFLAKVEDGIVSGARRLAGMSRLTYTLVAVFVIGLMNAPSQAGTPFTFTLPIDAAEVATAVLAVVGAAILAWAGVYLAVKIAKVLVRWFGSAAR